MPRELLTDGTDVTGWSDRRLLMRAVDVALQQASEIGALAGAQAVTQKEVLALKVRVTALEEMRQRAPSLADVEKAAHDAAEKAVEESGAHHALPPDVVTPNRMQAEFMKRELDKATAALKTKEDEEKARLLRSETKQDADRREKRDRLWNVLGPIIVAVVIGAGGIAYGIFRSVDANSRANDAEERGRLRGRAEVQQAPIPIVVPVQTSPPQPTASSTAKPR